MYRILKKKKGKANFKNLLVFYLTKGNSKFVLQIIAKKFYKTSPKFFVLSKKPQLLNDLFYKLSQKEESKKMHVEIFLSVTGVLYARPTLVLYEGYNTFRKIYVPLQQTKQKRHEIAFL